MEENASSYFWEICLFSCGGLLHDWCDLLGPLVVLYTHISTLTTVWESFRVFVWLWCWRQLCKGACMTLHYLKLSGGLCTMHMINCYLPFHSWVKSCGLCVYFCVCVCVGWSALGWQPCPLELMRPGDQRPEPQSVLDFRALAKHSRHPVHLLWHRTSIFMPALRFASLTRHLKLEFRKTVHLFFKRKWGGEIVQKDKTVIMTERKKKRETCNVSLFLTGRSRSVFYETSTRVGCVFVCVSCVMCKRGRWCRPGGVLCQSLCIAVFTFCKL